MAKHKKKRPAEGRLKVIAGGGGVKAVLPGKGPQWKRDRARPPSTGAHAASTSKSGPPNRRRDDDDDEQDDVAAESVAAKPARNPIPKSYIYGAIGIAVLVVAYFLLRNPPVGETPDTGTKATTSPSMAAASNSAATTSNAIAAASNAMASSSSPAASASPSPAASTASTASSSSAKTSASVDAKPKKVDEPSEVQ